MPKAVFGLADLLHRKEDFSKNGNFINKNYIICTWRDLKKIFVGYAGMINEILSKKFHPYSILNG
jgi:hypothetical protein